MRVKAIGRNLIVKTELERVEKKTDTGIIIPNKTIEGEEGGIQYHTVLDIGRYAFDDAPEMVDLVKVGTTVITTRYPGSSLYVNTEWRDRKVMTPYRLISCDEVKAIEHPEGAEIDYE